MAESSASTSDTSRHDVVIIGFGGAGACAAIEAADHGASVLLVDRFDGGGATAMSGGVVYLGGGTGLQRSVGMDDTAEQMFRYLSREVEDAVAPATLRAFCEQSREQAEWLRELGVDFAPRFYAPKTTQPPPGFGLYYSGNEKQRRVAARPVARGHVVDGTGLTGHVLYASLRRAVVARGVRMMTHAKATELLVDHHGSVVGVQLRRYDREPLEARAHAKLGDAVRALKMGRLPGAETAQRLLGTFEAKRGRDHLAHARGGVIIAAGGFVFDDAMLRRYAPRYGDCMPIGTAGDDGSGARLGLSVGASLREMSRCAASRFIAPPEALLSGVLVDAHGQRICDETLYGATLSKHIAERPGGKAVLIIDRDMWERARADMRGEEKIRDQSLRAILAGEANHILFRNYCYLTNLHVNRRVAASLEQLESECALPPGSLLELIREHNRRIDQTEEDAMGKDDAHRAPIRRPPFYAIGCDLDSKLFPGPCLTLGGLAVDGVHARVLRDDGQPIPGLYAAGRSAQGVASRSYVSGLSLADCVFSGRNAGREAAQRAAVGR